MRAVLGRILNEFAIFPAFIHENIGWGPSQISHKKMLETYDTKYIDLHLILTRKKQPSISQFLCKEFMYIMKLFLFSYYDLYCHWKLVFSTTCKWDYECSDQTFFWMAIQELSTQATKWSTFWLFLLHIAAGRCHVGSNIISQITSY